jgi:hypothetical protein
MRPPARIGGILLRSKPAGWPGEVRKRRHEFKEQRVTACGGFSRRRFEPWLDLNRPKTRRLVRPRLGAYRSRAPSPNYAEGRSDKRACLWTVEVAREGRNSLYIPPPEGGHSFSCRNSKRRSGTSPGQPAGSARKKSSPIRASRRVSKRNCNRYKSCGPQVSQWLCCQRATNCSRSAPTCAE